MFDDKKVSKVIEKKTSLYLKFTLIIFTVSICVLGLGINYVFFQYSSMQDNFFENMNTHIIEVSNKIDKDNPSYVGALEADDYDVISEIMQDENANYELFRIHSFPFGITDENNKTYYINSVSDEALKLYGIKLDDDCALCQNSNEKGEKKLTFPVISKSMGGFEASDSFGIDMKFIYPSGIAISKSIFGIYSNSVVVNENTYQKLMQKVYADSDVNSDKSEGLSNIQIYVYDLSLVKPIAKHLIDNNYSANYAMGAFSDIMAMLRDNYLWLFILMIAFLILAVMNTLVAFWNYIMTLRKDIGILMHYGYSSKRIKNIYIRFVRKKFLLVFALSYGVCAVTALVFVHSCVYMCLLISLGIIATVCLLNYVIVSAILSHVSKENILFLLRESKVTE
ncbi:ABC transporter permease [Butyrivibrio sp. NC3005]|uniref:ABC transporter permease n=1 Tax=Butyrivibrio sp. NC3005 TaxID=1280685 RepID=UPI00047BCC2F|nr:ABC transporter permease [Butyrivibrio sp. NC3005]